MKNIITLLIALSLIGFISSESLAQNKTMKQRAFESTLKKIFTEFTKAIDPNSLTQSGFKQVLERDGQAIFNHIRSTNNAINNGRVNQFNPGISQGPSISVQDKNALDYYGKKMKKAGEKLRYYEQLYRQDPERYASLIPNMRQLSIEIQQDSQASYSILMKYQRR